MPIPLFLFVNNPGRMNAEDDITGTREDRQSVYCTEDNERRKLPVIIPASRPSLG